MTGKEIKRLRKKFKMKQKDFAQKLGLTSRYWLSKVENGRVPVSKQMTIICELLEKEKRLDIDNVINK